MWPNYYVAYDYQDEVDYLKQWLSDRIDWMDHQFGFDPNARERGDANGDGEVTIADVSAIIDYLLSGDASSIDEDAADCDLNGSVEIADVSALIDYLLSGNWF